MLTEFDYIILYALTLSVGFYHFKKFDKNFLLKLWFYFVIYSFLTECITTYITEIYKTRTIVLHNTWFILNVIFYLFFYFKLVNNRINRKIIISTISLFIFSICVSFFYLNYSKDYFVYSWIIGQLLVVFTTMLFYAEVLKSEAILNFKKTLIFWISLGALIFNIGLLPVFIIGELINWQGIFNYIIFILNIAMTISFITGFIVSKKEFNN